MAFGLCTCAEKGSYSTEWLALDAFWRVLLPEQLEKKISALPHKNLFFVFGSMSLSPPSFLNFIEAYFSYANPLETILEILKQPNEKTEKNPTVMVKISSKFGFMELLINLRQ